MFISQKRLKKLEERVSMLERTGGRALLLGYDENADRVYLSNTQAIRHILVRLGMRFEHRDAGIYPIEPEKTGG